MRQVAAIQSTQPPWIIAVHFNWIKWRIIFVWRSDAIVPDGDVETSSDDDDDDDGDSDLEEEWR